MKRITDDVDSVSSFDELCLKTRQNCTSKTGIQKMIEKVIEQVTPKTTQKTVIH